MNLSDTCVTKKRFACTRHVLYEWECDAMIIEHDMSDVKHCRFKKNHFSIIAPPPLKS